MRARLLALLAAAWLAAACRDDTLRSRPVEAAPARTTAPGELALPARLGSVKFAAIGDSGRGHQPQYDIAAQMVAFRKQFDFSFVLMLGDNVYDGGTLEDYRRKFELPYKPLLDDGVKFYAAMGNHDDPQQHFYPLFNTGGHRYYTFKPPASPLGMLTGNDVQFFVLDTEWLDTTQLTWLDRELDKSDADWKIAVFHRPMYTSGRYAAPARAFRLVLEPHFVRHGVDVAFSGHEHFYERTKPQHGITYFVSGGAGSLRYGDIRRTPLTAAGFDEDYHFMLVEIAGDELHFQAISRTGATVDAGFIRSGPG